MSRKEGRRRLQGAKELVVLSACHFIQGSITKRALRESVGYLDEVLSAAERGLNIQ